LSSGTQPLSRTPLSITVAFQTTTVTMVVKGIIKGIFMLFFCFVYALVMFTVAKLMGSLQKKLDSKGRRLSFQSWKSLSQSSLFETSSTTDDSDNLKNSCDDFGEMTRRIQETSRDLIFH